MNIFVNQKIRLLFERILGCVVVFTLLSAFLIGFQVNNNAFAILSCSLCMAAAIVIFCYKYFREQHAIMEDAISQITDYISGNRQITIECNDEGELYRLFHEVNSLVSILNAHLEDEKSAKKFMKNTISDISHQLKTPLAALNIYNGIIQDEAKDLNGNGAVQEFSRLSEQELERIERLVQNLLKIAKLDTGTLILEKAFENVSELAESVKEHFLFRARQEGKEICLSGDGEATLFCDRIWMEEALGNLVKNALDHTGMSGVVRVEWKTFASVVQITVKDNGSGIHPEDIYHILNGFTGAVFRKTRRGLGLACHWQRRLWKHMMGRLKLTAH